MLLAFQVEGGLGVWRRCDEEGVAATCGCLVISKIRLDVELGGVGCYPT